MLGNELSSGLNLSRCGIAVGQRDRTLPPSLPSASAQMLPVMIHAHYGKLHPGPCRKPSGKLCLVKSPGCGRWEAHRLVTTIEPGRLTPHSRLEPETRPCPYQVLSITSWPEEAPQQRVTLSQKQKHSSKSFFPHRDTSESHQLPGWRLPNSIRTALGSRMHLGALPVSFPLFIPVFHSKMLNMNYRYSALNCNKSCIFHLLGYSSLSDTLYCLPEYFYKVFASFNL